MAEPAANDNRLILAPSLLIAVALLALPPVLVNDHQIGIQVLLLEAAG
jgi:hypothetical protein